MKTKHSCYIFLRPEDINGENPENYHLIEGEYTEEHGEIIDISIDGWYTVCNGCKRKGKLTRIPRAHILEKNDDTVRLFLAEQQNVGKRVCGNCVKHFYADDEN